jgi:hypothetical protein
MVSNNRFFEVLGQLRGGVRAEIRHLRNTRHVKGSERDLMFLELPQNPLRIVEYAAGVAKRSLLWDDVEWGIDNESCWVKQRFSSQSDKNYLEMIEKDHSRHEAEVFAALRLLSSVLKERNI